MRRDFLRFALCAGLLMMLSPPARATFHLMVIEEIYAGHPAAPEAHYVVLRMTSSRQQYVAGHGIVTFMPDGTPGPLFGEFANDASSGLAGRRILMATQQAVDFFGIAADHVTTGRLFFPSGRVCWSSQLEVDCLAYGEYTGDNGEYGQPAAALEPGLALHRIFFDELADNNATDFVLAAPMPTNNAGFVGGFDADSDLVPDFSDCAPFDPSLWLPPQPVTGVSVDLSSAGDGAGTVRWNSLAPLAGPSTLYDLILGSVQGLQATGGFLGVASCGAADLLDTSFDDPGIPASGDGRFYLVRGTNGCGVGSFRDPSTSQGTATPRDVLDDPQNDPCP